VLLELSQVGGGQGGEAGEVAGLGGGQGPAHAAAGGESACVRGMTVSGIWTGKAWGVLLAALTVCGKGAA
jgi:hypothetical protein